jgi:hypothetical protein
MAVVVPVNDVFAAADAVLSRGERLTATEPVTQSNYRPLFFTVIEHGHSTIMQFF